MTTTSSGTPIHLVCSGCGRSLVGTFFQIGERYLCTQCFNVGQSFQPVVFAPIAPKPDYNPDWLSQNALLREENTELKKQVANLEGKLQMIADWFHSRPMSASLTGAFTTVPRAWWLEGEPLLSMLCDIDSGDDED